LGGRSSPYAQQGAGIRYLAAQDPPDTKKQLQGQIDRFVAYYNTVRPHRAIGRRTPVQAFVARTRARPTGPRIDVAGYRVRRDKVDRTGTVTLRFNSKLHHIGVGRPYAGKRVIMLIAGRHVSVIGVDGSPCGGSSSIRRRTTNPCREPAGVYDVSRHLSPMSRDITRAEGVGFEPTVRMTYNGFRDRPIRPLSHPSGRHTRPSAEPRRQYRRSEAASGFSQPLKETRQHLLRRARHDAADEFQLVVEPRVAAEVVERSTRSGLRVEGPEDEATYPGGDGCAGAH
jgi:hypothetical protein